MLPTPPPSTKKPQGIFAPRQPRLEYYEDVYGSRNADEGAEGVADICESDSESDDELQRDEQHGRNVDTSLKTPESVSIIDIGSESENDANDDSDDSMDVYIKDLPYKIAPNVNRKRSLTGGEYDQLKSNRFGMFSGAVTEPAITKAAVAKPVEAPVENQSFMSGGRGRGESPISLADSDDFVFDKPPASKRSAKRKLRGSSPDLEEVDEAPRKRLRPQRPAHRQPIKQQLAEKARQDKAALRSTRSAAKAQEKAAKKGRRVGKRSTESSKEASGVRTAFVMLDNSGIDFEEYERSSKSSTKSSKGAKFVMVDNSGVNFEEYKRY